MAAELTGPTRQLPGPPELSTAEPLELMLYWRAIARRKWWLLGIALAFAAAAAVAVSYVTPIYRATVTLMIEQNKAKLVSIEEVYSGSSPNREHYQTQAELLRSPALASKVIERLRLTSHPEFDPRQKKPAPWLEFLPDSVAPDETGWTEEALNAAVLSSFLRRITIDPVRLTQLVKVGFDATDPELAARIANAIAETYIEADIEVRSRMRQRATDWLAERLADLKGNLESSERSLQQYRERESLPDTKGLAQSGVVRQMEVLSSALNEATERRIEAEANYRQIKEQRGNAASLPVVLRDSSIGRLRDLEAQAQRRVAELAQRYGPEHPRLAQARAELARARENTREGIDNVMSSFAREYQVALANERAAARAVAAAKGSIQQINRKEFQLEALEQDLDTNRQIYEKFMNRYRETRAATDTESSVVARVIDPAVQPTVPYKPRKREIVAGGFIAGLLLAAIGALLLERMNSTVKTGDEVEEKLGLPAFAIVPLLTGDPAKNAGRHYLEHPGSVFSEAIRTARTSILLSAIDAAHKVLLVTSSVPGEGKTSFAVNLALANAQAKKTLLIECDLRRPSIVDQLRLKQTTSGLTSLFAGEAAFLDCIQQVEGSSLYVLPSGAVPENPLELLSSERFAQFIHRVSAACDVVIIDSPPVHLVSDALVLATLATGVLFVVKADATPYGVARRSIRSLQAAGGNVIGVALNQVDFTKADRYYGAYTGYAQEYGAYGSNPT
ncbi:MAG TPA: polysaccharide biosynthesis tyrosine autokinase [Burkholderiales bacterium]|nr:polysaccharide biosynthesis tyrosine autokinase [Burkholderiales bacterium]